MPSTVDLNSAKQQRTGRPKTNEEIYERILSSVLEQRLHPGTKLAEGRLAEIFAVSRARIREVLARLAHDQVVELVPQRGAFVVRPTAQQARDVFEARRLIEPAIIRRLIETLTPAKLERLRSHQERELEARRNADTRSVIRLSGEFHSLIAELAGNTSLERTMRELSILTVLMIALYGAPTSVSCRADEHSEIIAAVTDKDVQRASQLMLHHLEHIEGSLRLDDDAGEADLEEIFGT